MSNRYIDVKMDELANIKGMIDKTSGIDKDKWTKKWYKVTEEIAAAIKTLNNAKSKRNNI
jgi:hypothetical protein